MKISICIPTYEMHGQGQIFLTQLFRSIKDQTYKNFEVIVSDHSKDDVIKKLCEEWQKEFSINYLLCEKRRGNASVNINNAISAATGDVIKPMHQDDFFYSPKALEEIKNTLEANPKTFWGVSAFCHTDSEGTNFFRFQTPFIGEELLSGTNTVGAPAVVFFRSNPKEYFDEEFIWMNDAELYVRLLKKHGQAVTLRETHIVIRQWPNQVTNTGATTELQERELNNFRKMYALPLKNRRSFFQKVQTRLTVYGKNFIADLMSLIRYWFDSIKKEEDLLSRLANKYRSDKGTKKILSWEGDRHFYSKVYNTYLDPIRLKPLSFLEIGIGSGSSLWMWQDYFKEAKIFGIDIEDFSRFNNDRATCFIADQSNRKDLKKVMEKIKEPLDVIIEDGGHYMHQQQISFAAMFHYLKSGGLYFIEDLHTSYWPLNGHDAVYNGIPIDIYPDRRNTTIKMIEHFLETKKIESVYLSAEEKKYLSENIAECKLYTTANNKYGPNHLAVFRKK